MTSVVGGAKKAGGMITGGLTKGFSMLGRGLTALRLGVMSMYSSIVPMIAHHQAVEGHCSSSQSQ